jgi:hypothetical protein
VVGSVRNKSASRPGSRPRSFSIEVSRWSLPTARTAFSHAPTVGLSSVEATMNELDRRRPKRLGRVVLLLAVCLLAAGGMFADEEVRRRLSATSLIFLVPALVFHLVQLARSR